MSPPDRPSLAELSRTRRLIIFDFDGPITRLLPDPCHIELADAVKSLLRARGVLLPRHVTASIDHVEVLRYAARAVPDVLANVERLCSATELHAAATAKPAPGALEVLGLLRKQQLAVAIVTNNDPGVVAQFAQRYRVDISGFTVHGRDPGRPERLKPSPWMLQAALQAHRCAPMDAMLVGDSTTDVAAARAAGMPCVGIAADRDRAAALVAEGAVEVVADLGVFL